MSLMSPARAAGVAEDLLDVEAAGAARRPAAGLRALAA